MNRTAVLALTGYAGSIALANLATEHIGLVPVGFGLMVTAGTWAAGATLILRDQLQATASRQALFAGIGMGIALSWVMASPALAVASAAAFTASELADLAVFTRLQSKSVALGVLASSIAAAPIDTVLFLHLAGFPITVAAVAGQLVVKIGLAAIVATALAARTARPQVA